MSVMKRKISGEWWVGILAIMMLMACGSGKYSEVEEIMSEQAQVTEDYVNGLDQAQSADDVVEVINAFSDGMKSLIPKIKEYKEKYPDLWEGKGEVPEKIQAQQQRLAEAGQKVQAATMNLMKYMTDPKVQQALANMGREMSQIQ